MAVCRICGLEDKRLPEGWVNWECLLCELEVCVTCTESIDEVAIEMINGDSQNK